MMFGSVLAMLYESPGATPTRPARSPSRRCAPARWRATGSCRRPSGPRGEPGAAWRGRTLRWERSPRCGRSVIGRRRVCRRQGDASPFNPQGRQAPRPRARAPDARCTRWPSIPASCSGALFFSVPGFEADGNDSRARRSGAGRRRWSSTPAGLGVPESWCPTPAPRWRGGGPVLRRSVGRIEVVGITGTNGRRRPPTCCARCWRRPGAPAAYRHGQDFVATRSDRASARRRGAGAATRPAGHGGRRRPRMARWRSRRLDSRWHRVDRSTSPPHWLTNFTADQPGLPRVDGGYWAAKRSSSTASHRSARWSTRTTSAAARWRPSCRARRLRRRARSPTCARSRSPRGGRAQIHPLLRPREGAERAAVRSRLPGAYNVDNVAAAAAAAHLLGAGPRRSPGRRRRRPPAGTPRAPGRGPALHRRDRLRPLAGLSPPYAGPASATARTAGCRGLRRDGAALAATRPEMAPSRAIARTS